MKGEFYNSVDDVYCCEGLIFSKKFFYKEICSIEKILRIIFKYFYGKNESHKNLNYLLVRIEKSLDKLQNDEEEVIILQEEDSYSFCVFKHLFTSITKLLKREEFEWDFVLLFKGTERWEF